MRKISRTSLKNLIAYEGEPVLTLYVPTHRFPTPPNIQEDQTRFKNLVRTGCEQWRAAGGETGAAQLQEKLETLLNDLNFWQESTETLVVFASAGAWNFTTFRSNAKSGFTLVHAMT